jgi:hypothetical protein
MKYVVTCSFITKKITISMIFINIKLIFLNFPKSHFNNNNILNLIYVNINS